VLNNFAIFTSHQFRGMHQWPDNNGGTGLDLLTKAMNDIAREIGQMDPNDPLRCERIS
jgi:hypothetical protein